MDYKELMYRYYDEVNERRFINRDLLINNRTEPLHEYIIEELRNLERVPNIKLVSYELITDESEFDPYVINKKHSKTKVVHSKYIPIDINRYENLRVKFHLELKQKDKIEEKEKILNLLLPKRCNKFYLILGGNKFYPIYQLIDSSTFNRKDSIVLKPINLKRERYTIYDSLGEPHNIVYYNLLLFSKKVNPLLYYLSPLGLNNTLIYLGLNDIIKVESNDIEYDENKYYNFRTSLNLSVRVLKLFLDEDNYTQAIVYSLLQLIDFYKIIDVEEMEDKDLWTSHLGTFFTTTDETLAKGKSVLVSFKSIATTLYKSNLKLNHVNKDSTHAILRWMMREFQSLKIKDNLDLKNKRVRLTAYMADYFAAEVSKKLNRFLAINEKKVTMKNLEDLVSYQSNIIISKLMTAKSPLLRYNNSVNDLDFFLAFKYSVKGPSSLGGNSRSIPLYHREIHHSHLGRIDVNSSSSSDPGITGYFTPFVKMIDGKFFDSAQEPQEWISNFKLLRQHYFEDDSTMFIPLKTMNKIEKETKRFVKKLQDIDTFIDNYVSKSDDSDEVILIDSDPNEENIKTLKVSVEEVKAKPRLFTKIEQKEEQSIGKKKRLFTKIEK